MSSPLSPVAVADARRHIGLMTPTFRVLGKQLGKEGACWFWNMVRVCLLSVGVGHRRCKQAILQVHKALQGVVINPARDKPRDTFFVTSTETRSWSGCPEEKANSNRGQQRSLKEGKLQLLSGRINSVSSKRCSLSACWEPDGITQLWVIMSLSRSYREVL